MPVFEIVCLPSDTVDFSSLNAFKRTIKFEQILAFEAL